MIALLALALALPPGAAPTLIEGVPYVEQQRAPWCAAAAAVMVGRFHGRGLALKPLVRALPVHADGIAWLDLIEALPGHGLSGLVVQADAAALRAVIDAGLPAIAVVKDGPATHALVVRGYDADGWRVLDPAAPGIRRLDRATFADRWTGGLVLLLPIHPAGAHPTLPLARWTAETARFRAEGWLHRARARPPADALALLRRAAAADPDHPAVEVQRAAVLGALGRGPEACAALVRARARLPPGPARAAKLAVVDAVAAKLGCPRG